MAPGTGRGRMVAAPFDPEPTVAKVVRAVAKKLSDAEEMAQRKREMAVAMAQREADATSVSGGIKATRAAKGAPSPAEPQRAVDGHSQTLPPPVAPLSTVPAADRRGGDVAPRRSEVGGAGSRVALKRQWRFMTHTCLPVPV